MKSIKIKDPVFIPTLIAFMGGTIVLFGAAIFGKCITNNLCSVHGLVIIEGMYACICVYMAVYISKGED